MTRPETVAIIAGGPSLTGVDLSPIRGRCFAIGVNRVAEHLPWVDACVTVDTNALKPEFGLGRNYRGRIIAGVPEDYGSPNARHLCDRLKRRDGITYWKRIDADGLPSTSGVLHGGADSGYGALCLAWGMKPRRIFLFGADCTHGKGWWYPQAYMGQAHRRIVQIMQRWKSAAPQLERAGIEVINASRTSRLDWWPRVSPQHAINLILEGSAHGSP